MIPGVRLDRNCPATYRIRVEGNVISFSILFSSMVWTWIAVRKMRNKPVVQPAGVQDTVCLPAYGIAVGWVLLSLAMQFLPGLTGEEPKPKGTVSLSGIQQSVILSGCLAFVLAVVYSIGNDKKPENGLPALRAVSLGIVAFVASLGPVFLVMFAIQHALGPNSASHALLEFMKKNKTPEAAMWVGASAVVTAPLLEELLYRVILQGHLRKLIHRDKAVVVVAVIFCVAHGWPNMLGLFPLAIALGVLYDRTNSYLAVVTAHAAFNMTMLLLTVLLQTS